MASPPMTSSGSIPVMGESMCISTYTILISNSQKGIYSVRHIIICGNYGPLLGQKGSLIGLYFCRDLEWVDMII